MQLAPHRTKTTSAVLFGKENICSLSFIPLHYHNHMYLYIYRYPHHNELVIIIIIIVMTVSII